MRAFADIKAVYLIGAGGIGVSALGRFFKAAGLPVSGYDKTPSPLTDKLISEGIQISFEDNPKTIPALVKNTSRKDVLIIYTPAVPVSTKIYRFFAENNFKITKRAEILGLISKEIDTVAVAGTHGKTSVSVTAAHVFKKHSDKSAAILGGIAKNYDSNLILDNEIKAKLVITEADEFDRSFLYLHPKTLIITSADADHLDIYEDINDLHRSLEQLIKQIKAGGILIIKKGLALKISNEKIKVYTYSYQDSQADFKASNIHLSARGSEFDLHSPYGKIEGLSLRIPGYIHIENAVAASAAALLNGVAARTLAKALPEWTGVKRRFEYVIKHKQLVYIDDYAHHPEELKAFIKSVRQLYEGKILGVFQPHLYSRTRDFADEFAQSLSELDELIITDIYPAREEPIPGISSAMILAKVKCKEKLLAKKEDLPEILNRKKFDVLLTMGAGDIDRLVSPIKKMLNLKLQNR